MNGQNPRSPIDLGQRAPDAVITTGDFTQETPEQQKHRLAQESLKSKHARRIEGGALLGVAALTVWLLVLYTNDGTPIEHKKMVLQAIIGTLTASVGYVIGKRTA